MKETQLQIEELTVRVTRKRIKGVYLRVTPPGAQVRVSAPLRAGDRMIGDFVLSKLDWIRARRQALLAREEAARKEYLPGEPHPLWGEDYPLELVEYTGRQQAAFTGEALQLGLHPGGGAAEIKALLEALYRAQLKAAIPPLIARWEPVMGVRVASWGVKRMKTRWGSCNPAAGRIWLSLHLAKLPPAALEYVVVHEMAHLLERSHGPAFQALMDRFLPGWRQRRETLRGHGFALEQAEP